MPCTSRSSTSCSRSVSAAYPSTAGGVGAAEGGRANSPRSLRASAGVRAGSPRATPSSSRKSSSEARFLKRYPWGPLLIASNRREFFRGGQDDYFDIRLLRADESRRGQAVKLGHVQVHEYDVGPQPPCLVDGFASVTGFAHC